GCRSLSRLGSLNHRADMEERNALFLRAKTEPRRERLAVLIDAQLLLFHLMAFIVGQTGDDVLPAIAAGLNLGEQSDGGVLKIGLRDGDALKADIVSGFIPSEHDGINRRRVGSRANRNLLGEHALDSVGVGGVAVGK